MINGKKALNRSLRWGMVGGAARRQLFAAGGREFGHALGVASERYYPDYVSLFAGEAEREDGIEAVSIATPNNTHFAICQAALNAGLHVVCEKPLCFTVEEADELERLSREKQKIVGVTYGYAGHQLIHPGRRGR